MSLRPSPKRLQQLARSIASVKLTKSDLGLELEELELVAYEQREPEDDDQSNGHESEEDEGEGEEEEGDEGEEEEEEEDDDEEEEEEEDDEEEEKGNQDANREDMNESSSCNKKKEQEGLEKDIGSEDEGERVIRLSVMDLQIAQSFIEDVSA